MWLRRAVELPWRVVGAIGALTLLSVSAVRLPFAAVGNALNRPKRECRGTIARRRRMPEVFEAQQVAVMLQMVQAAMQHKSQQLHLEREAAVELRQNIDGLQESLENMSYLFAQVRFSCLCCEPCTTKEIYPGSHSLHRCRSP